MTKEDHLLLVATRILLPAPSLHLPHGDEAGSSWVSHLTSQCQLLVSLILPKSLLSPAELCNVSLVVYHTLPASGGLGSYSTTSQELGCPQAKG